MCTAESFDCERFFFMDILPKIVKKEVSLTFVDPFENFSFGSTNKRTALGKVMPDSLLGQAIKIFAGYARS